MKTLVTMLVVAIVAAGAGIGVYATVIAPKLSGEKPKEAPKDKVPPTAKSVAFEEDVITILAPEKGAPAPMLLYSMSLLCSDEEAAKLVEADKAYFKEMLADLHRYKKREELDDPLIKEGIKKEALKKSNERLERLQVEPKEEVRVLDVFHTKFTVVDP